MSVSPAGTPSGTAIGVQGTLNGIPVPSSDLNNSAFTSWAAYSPGGILSSAQMARTRAMEVSLSAPGTINLMDQSGSVMSLPFTVTGVYQLPFVPSSITFSNGAAGSLWMLR
ncbi:MAG: hypothetical protein INR71_13860 [Terriglobus roseus]|nr:hypothetical protein [Terriglobus roseus]